MDHPDRVRHRLIRAIAVSDLRTMQEDIDFAFRQLVDIGLRALSSAINDPTTAVEATLRVGSLLRRLRVLRMLVSCVKVEGREEYVPALREQADLLLESLAKMPGLHPRDLVRLRAIAANSTDPADHSRRRLTP